MQTMNDGVMAGFDTTTPPIFTVAPAVKFAPEMEMAVPPVDGPSKEGPM